jgi:nucleoside-diphosphate-sugar epimerase
VFGIVLWLRAISAKRETRVILITGAAGNLGSLLARHLVARGQPLRLMYHRTPLPADLRDAPNVMAVQADLGVPQTLPAAVKDVRVVVHFAGVLFAPRPERFPPITNTQWFSNLVDASLEAEVERIILTSFPQVEGPTSVHQPATGRLDRTPISVHAQTRLAEERLLIEGTRGTTTTPVILRLGAGATSSRSRCSSFSTRRATCGVTRALVECRSRSCISRRRCASSWH